MSVRFDRKGFNLLICNFVSWYISQLNNLDRVEYNFYFSDDKDFRIFEVTKYNFSRSQVLFKKYVFTSEQDCNLLDYLYDINEFNCLI